MTMQVVIIGNSAAGTAAIEAIRQHDRKSRIVQISDEEFPLYSRCLLSYYLAGSVERRQLLYRDRKFHEDHNVTLHAGPGYRATQLDAGRQQISCDNGIKVNYDRLLICTWMP